LSHLCFNPPSGCIMMAGRTPANGTGRFWSQDCQRVSKD
jgi:hypothetical protein